MNNLELKIYVVSTVLLSLLDETDGDTKFKNKVRFHINRLSEELDKLTNVRGNNESDLFIAQAWESIESSIDKIID